MYTKALPGLFTLFSVAAALSESSPWVFLSTSAFTTHPNTNQIQTSSQVLEYTKGVLSSCSTDDYAIISQPGLRATDLRRSTSCALPHLCQTVKDIRIKGRFTVSEVVGEISSGDISDFIKSACSTKGKAPHIHEIQFASLPTDDKLGTLSENNEVLTQRLENVMSGESYTILFFSPPTEAIYEADFVEPVRMDLKRHVHNAPVPRRGNKTEWDSLPLFEKYQFFTPGIFMGIITAIVLFTILGVGLRALGSLEVSYGAFEKEMASSAQKKTQ